MRSKPNVHLLVFGLPSSSERPKGYQVHELSKDQGVGPLQDTLRDLGDQFVMVVQDINRVKFAEALPEVIPERPLFGASAEFYYSDDDLRYFYWKHYPRTHRLYNYLDANVILGRAKDILLLTQEAVSQYGLTVATWQDTFHRYHVDTYHEAFRPAIGLHLDHGQSLIASTRWSIYQSSKANWLLSPLLTKNEARIAKDSQGHLLNLQREDGFFRHINEGSHPSVVSIANQRPQAPVAPTRVRKWQVKLHALRDYIYVNKVNKWHQSQEQTFRYAKNRSVEMRNSIEQLIERLEAGRPLSFAHYNDGEFSFIQKFLANKHDEKWFGRKQQQYDPLLAGRLLEAVKFRKDGYFVGIPCATDHPALRKLADSIVGSYPFAVPAMTIHHNLAHMPRLLSALRRREVYFFKNEYQDLSFFNNLGIKVHESRVVNVPFKNSFKDFEHYASMEFPKKAVVVMTCGMLAKILTHRWYSLHDDLTILALGSSLDDHIQKSKINFELYPKVNPLTRNIKYSRSFLFGYKINCQECYWHKE